MSRRFHNHHRAHPYLRTWYVYGQRQKSVKEIIPMETFYSCPLLPEAALLKGRLLALLLLLLVGLAACGGSQPTGQPAAGSPSGKRLTAKVNPCSLLTRGQAEQILKTSLMVMQPQSDPHGIYLSENPCTYANRAHKIAAVLFLTTFPDMATARADFHAFATLNGSGFYAISGVGEQALFVTQPTPQLFVQKDNGILVVGVASTAAASVREQQERQFAQMAVQSM